MGLLPQQFPNLSAALVDEHGLVTSEWRRFFSTIWARTGSAIGGQQISTGMIFAYAAEALPDGYLLCDGSAVPRKTYPTLFTTLGVLWGEGDGTNTFNLPDFRGRSLVGANTTHALAALGGVESVMLTPEQLPVHTHELIDPGHTHVLTDAGHTHNITDTGHIHTASAPDHTHTIIDPGHLHTFDAGGAAVANTIAMALGTIPNVQNTASATTGITVDDASITITVDSEVTGVTVDSATTAATIGSALTGITIEAVGEGTEIETMSPWAGVKWIIKT